MTSAKAPHLAARTLLIRHLDMHPGKTVENDLDPAEVGIVGDTAHAEGGDSYHLGKDQIRARNGRDRYSVDESSRDRDGLDDNASAMDVGWFSVKTPRGTFTLRDFSRWLAGLCAGADPDTRDIREVIYSPDGQSVRRWDRLGRRSSGDDSHLFHTHISEFRDASGTRMVKIATRWLQRIGLLPEGDDMSEQDATAALEKFFVVKVDGSAASGTQTSRIGKNALDQGIPNPFRGSKTEAWRLLGDTAQALALLRAEVAALAGRDFTDEGAIVAGVLAGLDPQAIAAAIPRELAQQVADELAARLQG